MKKILLVDDVKLLLEIQKKFLANSYVQVLTANDGMQALYTARRELPDLIIMDKYMPVMDGLTCCKQLKEDASLSHIPIIMSTNATLDSDTREYMAAGCADILAKPIDCKLFLNAIKKHIPDIERRSVRVPVRIETVMSHSDAVHRVSIENISINGLFAVTDLNLPVNEEVRFTFVLPERNIPMEVRGKVVWQRRSGEAPGFGAEFIEVLGQGISMLRLGELKSFVASFGQTNAYC